MNCSAGCVLGLISHTTLLPVWHYREHGSAVLVHIVRFPPNKGVMVCPGPL